MSAGYLAKCSRKVRHPSQAKAEEHRRYMIRVGMWRAGSSNTYPCNQCGCWHAGRMKGAPRGKGRKAAKNTPRFLASQ